MTTELFEKGLNTRRKVLGAEHVDKAMANVDAFSKPMQELVTEFCWGACWGRDGLSLKERSLVNLSMIAALNRPHEFQVHVRGALNNGVSVEEIQDVCIHIATYCGMPAGLESFRLAKAVLEAEGKI